MTTASTTENQIDYDLYAFCDEALAKLVRSGPGAFCAALSADRIDEFRTELLKPGAKTDQRYLLNCLIAVGRAIRDNACSPDKMYERVSMFITAFDSYCQRKERSSVSAMAATSTWG